MFDLLKEAVGVEHGLWHTVKSLRVDPKGVLNGYLTGDLNYSSPFKLLMGVLTIWLLVNGFIIDWYAIWAKFIDNYLNFLYKAIGTELTIAEFHKKMASFRNLFIQFGGDLFGRIYIPFILAVLPLSAWLAQRFTHTYEVSFRKLLAVNSYVMGANGVVFLGMSIVVAINFYVFMAVALVLVVLALFGINFLMMIPPRRFFDQHGAEIERGIVRANTAAVMLMVTLLMTGYVIWFMVLK